MAEEVLSMPVDFDTRNIDSLSGGAYNVAENTTNLKTEATGMSEKYVVDQFTFPNDLFGNTGAYGDSWMMININMLTTSKYANETAMADIGEGERRKRNTEADARNNTVGGATTNIGTSAAAAAAVSQSGNILGGLVQTIGGILNRKSPQGKQAIASGVTQAGTGVAKAGFAGALAGVSSGVVYNVAGTATRETKRIKSAIQLPMPNSFNTSYGARWGEDSTNMFDLMARGVSENFDKAGEVAAMLLLGAQNIVQAQGMSAATGIAVNPKKEMYFESMGFRNFSLLYKFYPRTPAEAKNLQNILYLLKFHMHPEYKSDQRYTFVYPSEFDITFYHKGNENLWVNKIATCVLTDMSVEYAPDAQWVQHDGGIHNAINLQLTFKELSVLTKETIKEGF